MSEVFESGNFELIARLAVVQVIDHVAAAVEVNQVEMKLVAHAVDVRDQVLLLLLAAINVARLVNQPGNHRVRTELSAQLLGPDPRGMDEIRPPMIVRDRTFVLFPDVERWSADEQTMYSRLLRPGRSRSEKTEEE